MRRKRNKISCSLEVAASSIGLRNICGVDEAGRGPLAGPVVAAAVILQPGCNVSGINDSKKLSPRQRDKMYDAIIGMALDYSIAGAETTAIDELNILHASLQAMRDAVRGLRVRPGILLVDGKFAVPGMPQGEMPQLTVCGGDAASASIAAASILAKVSRDRRMVEYDELYPGYGFARHKGYGTAEHMSALRRLGPCPIHRASFEPVRVLMT